MPPFSFFSPIFCLNWCPFNHSSLNTILLFLPISTFFSASLSPFSLPLSSPDFLQVCAQILWFSLIRLGFCCCLLIINSPYKLVAVPPDQVNPEHYIFSPFGILHIHPVEGSEAMTLGTWHRDCALWRELQRIPFFKNCLLRKALTW